MRLLARIASLKSGTKNLLAAGLLACAALAMLAVCNPPKPPPASTYEQEFEAFRVRREAELEKDFADLRAGAAVAEVQKRRDEANRRRQREINEIRARHGRPPLPAE